MFSSAFLKLFLKDNLLRILRETKKPEYLVDSSNMDLQTLQRLATHCLQKTVAIMNTLCISEIVFFMQQLVQRLNQSFQTSDAFDQTQIRLIVSLKSKRYEKDTL